jgi:hypothetical protein
VAARPLLLFALALSARLALVFAYPAVHGGDSVARLARSDELLLAYQLPLPQLLVWLARALVPDPLLTRVLFAAIGALVPVALLRAMRPCCGELAATLAGLLAALQPLLLYYSLVPYQESLMLVLLLEGALALQQGREGRAGLLIGLACLCRYEAWIAAALAIAARGRLSLRTVAAFGWAPLLWVLWWKGLSPPGTYVLDPDASSGRLGRLVFLALKLREYGGWSVLAAALAGALVALRQRRKQLAWPALYVTLALLAVAVAGHEFPPGSGRVSERLAHIPALAVCALAGIALAQAAERLRASQGPLASAAAVLLVLALGQSWVRFARDLVAVANRDPSLLLAFQVGRLASRQLGDGELLAVIAPPVPESALRDFVGKVERSGHDAERAREIARALARHSPDTDRIAANLARPPRTVVEDAAGASLVALFDDADRAAPPGLGPALARFQAGDRGVTVYRSSRR